MRRRALALLLAGTATLATACGGDAQWYNYLFPFTLLFKAAGDCPVPAGAAANFTVQENVAIPVDGGEPIVADLYAPVGDGPFTAVIFAGKAGAFEPADYARAGAVVLDLGYAAPAPAEVLTRAADWLLGQEGALHLAPGCVGEAG